MESVLTSWPIVFFWPAVVMGLMLSALGLVWRRSSLPTAGAIVTLPAALYLSATPRFQFVGFVPVACLLLAAYTVRRDEALLHEYPLRVGRRGPHFSGPSAGATLRE